MENEGTGRRGRDDPDRLLGLGEIADHYGIPHLLLRRALREGRLPTCTGWRGKRLVRAFEQFTH